MPSRIACAARHPRRALRSKPCNVACVPPNHSNAYARWLSAARSRIDRSRVSRELEFTGSPTPVFKLASQGGMEMAQHGLVAEIVGLWTDRCSGVFRAARRYRRVVMLMQHPSFSC